MPSRTDTIREEVASLGDDIRSLFVAAKEDPGRLRRKRWAWRLLYGGLAAAFALAGRRVATRVWWILTGRRPPTRKG